MNMLRWLNLTHFRSASILGFIGLKFLRLYIFSKSTVTNSVGNIVRVLISLIVKR